MAVLKLLLATTVFLTVGVLLINPHLKIAADPQHFPLAPTHIRRGELVQELFQFHSNSLQGYYESLSAVLKANAPDILPMLQSPKPLQHGYQILPRIVPDAAASDQRSRARSIWYSWPWTDQLIKRELKEIARSKAELERARALKSIERRSVYEKLAESYRRLSDRQRNIDAHIQYNRLWQPAIAANRSTFNRETVLHDAVLERQAILDTLNATEGAASKRALAGMNWIGLSQSHTKIKSGLIEREKMLARHIYDATYRLSTPPFVRVEQREPNLWILNVPFYTDIEDHDFVRSVKENIENIWRLRDGNDEFRIELAISFIRATQLYTERQPPSKGDRIDAHRHVLLFPLDRAILTTSALTTHVYSRAIILGPHDIAARVLAHEFGHILGFKDVYFRGYKDLGKNGFQVMEVVADPSDIMGAPGTGAVVRSHFERILARFAKVKSSDGSARYEEKVMPRKLLRPS